MKNFYNAVAFGEMVLRGIVCDRQLRSTDLEPMEIVFSLALPVLNGTDERGGFYKCADRALTWLVSQAELERGAFDLAIRIVASRLVRGEALPESGRVFAGLCLVGMIKPPSKTKKAATFSNNLMLYWTAKRIEQDFGLTLTRGDDTGNTSACDAVSQALERLGHAKTYRAIKELCHHKSSGSMRQIAHECHRIMNEATSKDPEMLIYWQSQAPWNSVTE